MALNKRKTTPPKDAPKWTDIVSALLSFAALTVAVLGWATADRQADTADAQTNLARATLDFARKEAADDERDTQAALNLTVKSLAATRDVADAGFQTADAGREAASASKQGVAQAQVQAANTALLNARLEGFRRFVGAVTNLDAAIQRLRAASAFAGYDPEDTRDLLRVTLPMLRAGAPVFREGVYAGNAFSNSVDGARGVWPGYLETQYSTPRSMARL